jgi:hypothetical protein
MGIAHAFEGLVREELVRTLGFLETQHIGLAQLQVPFDVCDPQADRIYVPGRNGETHRRAL